MNIRKVWISNFQSHRDTTVVFDGGVNVITGNSDVGKSAIIRALRWVFRNKPDGDGYWNTQARQEGLPVTVEVVLDDGTVIARQRGTGLNRYVITDANGSLELTAFGRDVPELVKIKLGEPSFIGSSPHDINFDMQFDSPFLLSSVSPRDFAILLGKLTGVVVLDKAEQAGNRLIKDNDRERLLLQRTREERVQELASVIDPVPAKHHLNAAIRSYKYGKEVSQRHERLFDHSQRLERVDARLETLRPRSIVVVPDIDAVTKAIERYNVLNRLSRRWDSCMTVPRYPKTIDVSAIDRLKRLVKYADSAKKPIPSPVVQLTSERIDRLVAVQSLLRWHNNVTKQLDSVKGHSKLVEDEMEQTRNAFNRLMRETTVCPLSGGVLFDECKRIIKEDSQVARRIEQ